ncbi:hypothetical protein FPOAC2_00465 [Fusarium poae]
MQTKRDFPLSHVDSTSSRVFDRQQGTNIPAANHSAQDAFFLALHSHDKTGTVLISIVICSKFIMMSHDAEKLDGVSHGQAITDKKHMNFHVILRNNAHNTGGILFLVWFGYARKRQKLQFPSRNKMPRFRERAKLNYPCKAPRQETPGMG